MGLWRFSLAGAIALYSLTSSSGPAQQATSGQSQQNLDRIYQSLPQTDLSSDRLAPIAHVPPPAPGFARAHVADNPLAPVPILCQQCHATNNHAGALQTRQNIGVGANPEAQAMGCGRLTCHANIHGSNAPSGPRLHQ
jgi:hypothetical protein